MKVKVPLGALLLLAIVLGYVLGTEKGRAQRDAILARMGRTGADDSEAAADEKSASPDSSQETGDVASE